MSLSALSDPDAADKDGGWLDITAQRIRVKQQKISVFSGRDAADSVKNAAGFCSVAR